MAIVLPGKKNKEREAAEAAAAEALNKKFNQRLQATLQRRITARNETRAHPRTRDLRVASAAFSPVAEKTCRVLDHSYSGMRLQFLSNEACPDEFALTIPTLSFIGVVKKTWQSGDAVGVSIVRWSDAA